VRNKGIWIVHWKLNTVNRKYLEKLDKHKRDFNEDVDFR